ncbi:hypothetical protein I4F81_000443 [Pyropia yezoensis]|uniref:Uncharacterized protein n=1 Tax=Pyropia yezoensis TaxID=2788 RepID=A0ACC3BJ90_PYRYE|nr:hypothetical protein I4F81_000443 [Neopyropia yezoensis]
MGAPAGRGIGPPYPPPPPPPPNAAKLLPQKAGQRGLLPPPPPPPPPARPLLHSPTTLPNPQSRDDQRERGGGRGRGSGGSDGCGGGGGERGGGGRRPRLTPARCQGRLGVAPSGGASLRRHPRNAPHHLGRRVEVGAGRRDGNGAGAPHRPGRPLGHPAGPRGGGEVAPVPPEGLGGCLPGAVAAVARRSRTAAAALSLTATVHPRLVLLRPVQEGRGGGTGERRRDRIRARLLSRWLPPPPRPPPPPQRAAFAGTWPPTTHETDGLSVVRVPIPAGIGRH